MPYDNAKRVRANRNYFLLRVSEFENFQDPDVFSPHMDLLFVRRVYAEFRQKLPDISFDTTGFESTPCVLATRPERAARDLARKFLVSSNAKYAIEILQSTPETFTFRYRRSWRQLNDAFGAPTTVARDMVVFRGAPYDPDVNQYDNVELPFLSCESVFVQFFRLEPSFQFYEYAAVIEPMDNRRLRLPGWNADAEAYTPFDKKILVKSLFRPFQIKQGAHVTVCSANSARDAFVKSKADLQANGVRIEITDSFTKHRYVNNAGEVRFLSQSRPNVQAFKRRADNKRKRTHCVEKNYLFERAPFYHVLHSSYRTEAVFFRELRRQLSNALSKFRAIEASTRMNDRMKESATFVMLRNRWFLMACAITTGGADEILERAFELHNNKNPARYLFTYGDFPPNLYDTIRNALEGVDDDTFDDAGDFVHEVDVDTLAARNIPIPPSLGCTGNRANETTQPNMQVVEGHNPFPDELLAGAEERTFAQWEAVAGGGSTRADILDTYTKSIRDDIPRIQKRQTPFGDYLLSISIEPFVLEAAAAVGQEPEPEPELHFGQMKSSNYTFGKVILSALYRFLGI